MSSRSKAQRAAEARYEKKRRGIPVMLRLEDQQAAWLDEQRAEEETRQAAIKRLAGMPGTINEERS